MIYLRCTFALLAFMLFCSACGGNPVQFGVQGPFPPYISISSDAEFSGDLPIEVSAYITYDGIEETSLMVDWGEGDGWVNAVPDDYPNLFLHTYSQEGTYDIRVKALADNVIIEDSATVIITAQDAA